LPPNTPEMTSRPEFSIVVPLFNEQDNVAPLVGAVNGAMVDASSWELLLVDDGSSDGTRRAAREAARDDGRVRLIRLARNYGQTSALQAGFDNSAGNIVITMDGDLQNDPADIPRLLAKLAEGYDLVTGYRVRRQDNVVLRLVPSWLANRLIRWLTGVSVRDTGCSLKAFRRDILVRMHLYSDMHRFIPVVAAATSGARIAEIPVNHRARLHGESKYGLSRVWKVLVDLIVIGMIRSFREKPMALFARWSMATVLVGALFVLAMVLAGAGRPELAASSSLVIPGSVLLWVGLAIYLLMLGLIAETALYGNRERRPDALPIVRETRV